MKTRTVVYLIVTSVFQIALLCSCSQPGDQAGLPTQVPLPSPGEGSFPRIDGSTSTAPLGAMIVCAMMNVPCDWVTSIDGNKYLMPDVTDYQGNFPVIGHSGTHAAYLNLINGEVDLILVAREPSSDELDFANLSGVTFVSMPAALDAFVFIVNEENPVKGLSLDQIQRIYTGEITSWDQVGGLPAEIHPYQRDEQSGSQQLMLSLVMKGLPMVDAPLLVLLKMIAPFYAISEDPLGIGYSVYYYEENMAPNEKVKLLAVNDIIPEPRTIQSRQYPFATEVYAVLRADSTPESIEYQLRDWLLSPAGQDLVAQSGYVPVHD